MPSPTSTSAAQSQPVPRRPYQPPHLQQYRRQHPSSSAGSTTASRPDTDSHTHGHNSTRPSTRSYNTLPLFFRLPFQSNSTSSASLAPSVAEGRPIPVDDTTAEHRTEALRELNSHYPSRHRYAKSTGAQNTTYSEPVIVRSYYRPTSDRTSRMARGASSNNNSSSNTNSGGIIVVRNGPRSAAGSVNGSVASRTKSSPFAGKMASASSGMLSIMARARGVNQQQQPPNRPVQEDAKLPPLEAFTFKSFIDNLDQQQDASSPVGDINADLDRIAEICARSRYSLSNQYEVHYGPHGTGAAFATQGGPQGQESHGPTLQAVTSDDESNATTERKRRLGVRRNSRAMGTLETIMSSSRSSDDDRSRKKSAAEIAAEVRGRAASTKSSSSQRVSPAASTTSSSAARQGRRASQDAAATTPSKQQQQRPTVKRTSSSSLALIDAGAVNKTTAPQPTTAKVSEQQSLPAVHRAPVVSLVGQPALVQPRSSQLQVQTATTSAAAATDGSTTSTSAAAAAVQIQQQSPHQADRTGNPCACPVAAKGAVSTVDGVTAMGFLSTLAGWIPWSSSSNDAAILPQRGQQQGRAAGSLRNLLDTAENQKPQQQ